jgi:endonuclease/exonuclease/phosphatase family metal-dependent hydrolase
VATYNVHGCIGSDGRHDPDRIATVINELDADVVALQEFTYPASVALDTRTPVVLTTLDRYECALGPTRERRRKMVTECFGNALLTRHPLIEVHRIDLSRGRREPRGALAATVDLGDGLHLHVLGAHLGLRLRERRFQVQQILDYLATVRNERVIVLGDFNDWLPGRSAAHVLDTLLGRPLRRPSFPARWPLLALDRIWVKPAAALCDARAHISPAARRASDHLPIVGELSLVE